VNLNLALNCRTGAFNGVILQAMPGSAPIPIETPKPSDPIPESPPLPEIPTPGTGPSPTIPTPPRDGSKAAQIRLRHLSESPLTLIDAKWS
jgi:hypothetical protein